MKTRTTVYAVALVLLGVALTIPAIGAGPAENIEQMVASAKTPADHEAIAAYYDKEAAQAGAEVRMHAELAARYKSFPRLSTQAMHCERMAHSYQEAAGDARALAAEHREMAKQAAKGSN